MLTRLANLLTRHYRSSKENLETVEQDGKDREVSLFEIGGSAFVPNKLPVELKEAVEELAKEGKVKIVMKEGKRWLRCKP